MGINKRQSTRTNASVNLVLRSLIILLTGMLGWRMPMVNGSRAGLVCAKTSSSHRLRVSPRNLVQQIEDQVAAGRIVFGCNHPVCCWVLLHASWLHNHFTVSEGLTPFERGMDRSLCNDLAKALEALDGKKWDG